MVFFSSIAQRDILLIGLFGFIWINNYFGRLFQSQVPDLLMSLRISPTGKFSTAINKGEQCKRREKKVALKGKNCGSLSISQASGFEGEC